MGLPCRAGSYGEPHGGELGRKRLDISFVLLGGGVQIRRSGGGWDHFFHGGCAWEHSRGEKYDACPPLGRLFRPPLSWQHIRFGKSILFAKNKSEGLEDKGIKTTPTIYSVILKIEKLADFTNLKQSTEILKKIEVDAYSEVFSIDYGTRDDLDWYDENGDLKLSDLWVLLDNKNIVDKLIAEGSSGSKFTEPKGRGNSYAVFDSSQIKLADGSNTTFNPNNPDIRFEPGGKIKSKVKYKFEFNDEPLLLAVGESYTLKNGVVIKVQKYSPRTKNNLMDSLWYSLDDDLWYNLEYGRRTPTGEFKNEFESIETFEQGGNIKLKGKITIDNFTKYLDYLKSGGKLKASDLIDLSYVVRDYYKKERDKLYDRAQNGEITFEEADPYKGKLGRKITDEEYTINQLIVSQENAFGLEGDENAKTTYHFTTPENVLSILSDNFLYGEGETSGLSTTTNSSFDNPELTSVQSYGVGNKPTLFSEKGIRIDLDLQKLKEDGIKIRKGGESLGTFEGEEELKIGGINGIGNASKYISQIQIDRKIVDEKTFNKIKEEAELKGINVIEKTNYERKFNEYELNKSSFELGGNITIPENLTDVQKSKVQTILDEYKTQITDKKTQLRSAISAKNKADPPFLVPVSII